MLALDTSAFVKRYLDEPGGDFVREVMDRESDWAGSSLMLAEARITVCHAAGSSAEREAVERVLLDDWADVQVVPVDAQCLGSAVEIGCTYRIRTLGAIHLAAAIIFPAPCSFLTFDARQRETARALGLDVVPLDA